jgi:hypothetical protein
MPYEFTHWEDEPDAQASSSRAGGPRRKFTGGGVADPSAGNHSDNSSAACPQTLNVEYHRRTDLEEVPTCLVPRESPLQP